jgi:mycothiol synthase
VTAIPPPPAIAGVTWRSAVLSDAPAIADLQEACFAVDGGYQETASEIGERFESPMADVGGDSLVGVTRSGAVLASLWSYLVPKPTEVWSVYDDNYVHPAHRTEGLRAFALDWWQARGLERVVAEEVGEGVASLPIRFHQQVYPIQLEHIEDIARLGFEPWLYVDELRRDLTQPIGEGSLPAAYQLVSASTVAPAELLAVRNDAFRDHRGSQAWTIELWESRQTESYRADASFAVVRGGEAVAFVKCAVFPHDEDYRGFSEGWIEQVGTKREHRGNGLAAVLIRAAMRVFASDGIEYATLEVDTENPTGAHGLYTRLGFERVGGYVDYTKVVHPRRTHR